ncbi:MAG: TonB-dependent receptor plug domain-containing protein, partial [Bordetella sp.]|nr:TonB-dependent receptor plug domain-containing protein [Bordetella sp.]
MKKQNLAWLAAVLPWYVIAAQAQTAAPATDDSVTLNAVKVEASADASASGLAAPFAGGQVATGSRIGILGTRSNLETPFSTTAYTNELIQDKQAHGVGDVLQNDPGVRVARGYGNFQESYFIRGFTLSSDDIAYNGLYGLMPRQYISTQLFERVEVLRGASAFLTGASPNGGGIGGAINLVPKRAPNEPLNRFTVGYNSDSTLDLGADVARRFGPDDSFGIRLNAAQRGGESGVDDERSRITVFSLGLDWRGERARLSADLGYQQNRMKRSRPSVTLAPGVTTVPDAPDARRNFAQD